MSVLNGWENFYVVVGTSAGALIGLQFVVMTLIADLPVVRGQGQAAAAFATPTIVHFCNTLLLAATILAPWRGPGAAAMAWGAVGLGGLAYEAVTIRRMRRQTAYQPVAEDWLFHAWLPSGAYATLAVSALFGANHTGAALAAVALVALALLFIGIHNAWDSVTYHILVQRARGREGSGR